MNFLFLGEGITGSRGGEARGEKGERGAGQLPGLQGERAIALRGVSLARSVPFADFMQGQVMIRLLPGGTGPWERWGDTLARTYKAPWP